MDIRGPPALDICIIEDPESFVASIIDMGVVFDEQRPEYFEFAPSSSLRRPDPLELLDPARSHGRRHQSTHELLYFGCVVSLSRFVPSFCRQRAIDLISRKEGSLSVSLSLSLFLSPSQTRDTCLETYRCSFSLFLEYTKRSVDS